MSQLESIEEIFDAPCCFCGYNGQGYWQSMTHDIDCPFYFVAGDNERRQFFMKALSERAVKIELDFVIDNESQE